MGPLVRCSVPKPSEEAIRQVSSQLEVPTAPTVGLARPRQAEDRNIRHAVSVRLRVAQDLDQCVVDGDAGAIGEEVVVEEEADRGHGGDGTSAPDMERGRTSRKAPTVTGWGRGRMT